uniref:Uncharacterized protein n=1 Tax=Ralstonia solanacearum TaxID=305 RepID=A0A0S4WMN8_RALSL|nr:protein of unknown function [Ralstonia solanacearum]CUV32037.1 protein of unknown function [Ralstonia solanacearum]CUV39337.1 protein of unknown function [Ralstonia solanacearum]CUV48067.1 protein of unknown function [Ralstonia solanacearum]CUV58409.1 protein of unknown function [Ralstonia solanacearum]
MVQMRFTHCYNLTCRRVFSREALVFVAEIARETTSADSRGGVPCNKPACLPPKWLPTGFDNITPGWPAAWGVRRAAVSGRKTSHRRRSRSCCRCRTGRAPASRARC